MMKLTELDRLLHRGCTGDSTQLAKRIGISRSTLFRLFGELKYVGAEIEYDASNRTYYYKRAVRIVFAVGREDRYLLIADVKKIVGGVKNRFLTHNHEKIATYI